MGSFMVGYATSETNSSLSMRLSSIKFETVTSYRVYFQEIIDIITMMKRKPPSEEELSKMVLDAMSEKVKGTAKALLTLAKAASSGRRTSLEGKTWQELLDLMDQEERSKADLAAYRGQRKEPARDADDSSSSSSESSSEDFNAKKRKKKKKQRKKKVKRPKKQPTQQNPKQAASLPAGKVCYRCGSGGHRANVCHHINTKCRKCSKMGHIERVCKGGVLNGPPAKGGAPPVPTKKKVKFAKKKKKKKKKKSSDDDSDSESDSSSAEESNLACVEDLTLYNDIDSKMDEFEETVLSTPHVKKPALMAMFNFLLKFETTLDSGTRIDLLSERTLLALRDENARKGNSNQGKYRECKIVVKAAGGRRLEVLGKVFMHLSFGKKVDFKTVFVIVRDLGVPALLGTATMHRVGIDLCFTKPYRIVCQIAEARGGGNATFPLETDAADVVESYLTLYDEEVCVAISKAEAPTTHESFDGRVREKVLSSC
jgi:hypothetical protein